ncbi:MAG: hypothetical protein ACREQ5_10655 [Candidatus Dormibacteria bacterium]
MPPKNRSGRSAFGGKLLAVPTPLPDDDEESASAAEEVPPTKPTEPPPAPESASVLLEPAPASLQRPPDEANAASPRRPSRERAPGTIRLDDRSGQALWEAYIEAKVQDPFLSYRQFASRVVHDGLAVHRRRQKRTS